MVVGLLEDGSIVGDVVDVAAVVVEVSVVVVPIVVVAVWELEDSVAIVVDAADVPSGAAAITVDEAVDPLSV